MIENKATLTYSNCMQADPTALDWVDYAQMPSTDLVTLFQQQTTPHACSKNPQRTRENILSEFYNRFPRKTSEEKGYVFLKKIQVPFLFKDFRKETAFRLERCKEARNVYTESAKKLLNIVNTNLQIIKTLHPTDTCISGISSKSSNFRSLELATEQILKIKSITPHLKEESKLRSIRLNLINTLEKTLQESPTSISNPIDLIISLCESKKQEPLLKSIINAISSKRSILTLETDSEILTQFYEFLKENNIDEKEPLIRNLIEILLTSKNPEEALKSIIESRRSTNASITSTMIRTALKHIDKSEFMVHFIDKCGNSNNLSLLGNAAVILADQPTLQSIKKLYGEFIEASMEILTTDEKSYLENIFIEDSNFHLEKALNFLEQHRARKTHHVRNVLFITSIIVCIALTALLGPIGAISWFIPVSLYFLLYHTTEDQWTEKIEALTGIIYGEKDYYKNFFTSINNTLIESNSLDDNPNTKDSNPKRLPEITQIFLQIQRNTTKHSRAEPSSTFKELKNGYTNFIESFEILLAENALSEQTLDYLISNKRFLDDLFLNDTKTERLCTQTESTSKTHKLFLEKVTNTFPDFFYI